MHFAGHETFHIRDGWLHKGMSAIRSNPMIFADPYATDSLGVGRNMVNAIRYWLVATGLAAETTTKVEGRPKPRLELTPFGELVQEFDPYLEEDLTLWLLHYHMASNEARATTWYWLFNMFPMKRFDSQSFINFLSRWVGQQSKKAIALPSLQKDLNCVLRTYTPPVRRHQKSTPEETFECPLASLRLIDFLENSATFRMNIANRPVPPAVMGYSVLRFIQSLGDDVKEAHFQDLASAPKSPGRVFLLTSDGLLSNLDRLQEEYGKKRFSYTRTAGMNLLRIGHETPEVFLRNAYQEWGTV